MTKLRKDDLIFITGHRGMVGSGIARKLKAGGYVNLLTASRKELDLRERQPVDEFISRHRPDVVVHAAARVGGIRANIDAPADFLLDNVLMNMNVTRASTVHGVRRLCFLGSSCIYPRECEQPMREESLLTGRLEPTNEGYALAKITGLRYAEYCHRQYGLDAFSVMPCNLYGTNDHFDLAKSHVITALVKRFCDAVDRGDHVVTVWGSGSARREFLHVDDAAAAIVMLLEQYERNDFINVGPGDDVTIGELSKLVASLAGFQGRIEWDLTKPDGMPRKCLDVSRLRDLGYRPSIPLEEGVAQTIAEYRALQRKRQP